jgi:tetratricopeptide (TPR) repeat protein
MRKGVHNSLSSLSARAGRNATSDIAFGRSLFFALRAITLVYALLANLRTVSDNDIGWLLATGRWVAQHHHVFSTDVFSYTAYGQPWVYPVGSALLFYFLYLLGGYALLSWSGAIACAGTAALLLRRGSVTTAALAIIAVPLIAYRTYPHADMFTVVIFAAFLSILWENYENGNARLWLLPLLMMAWVNLHLGFIAGLGLLFGFAGIDLLEMLPAGTRRQDARQRLKRELPWFLVTLLATVLNPWGWSLYQAILRQDRVMAQHARWLTEWFGLPLNWTVIANSITFRNTYGAVYWVLGIALLAAVVALLQRQLGEALLLIGASCATIRHIRMEALTACVVVIVGGSVLHSLAHRLASRIPNNRLRLALPVSVGVLSAAFACAQSIDLVTGRHYLVRNDISTFGAGAGWWYPQQAAAFIEREKPPGRIFNTMDEGGFLLATFGADYRDAFDGRAIPFGPESFERQQELLQASLDSPLWQQQAERFDINTFILPLARFHMTPLQRLKDFCNSENWRPVYLDEVSAVFVRRTPETESLIKRSGLDCSTVPLPVQPVSDSPGIAFNRWANAAAVLSALGRPYEALAATDEAGRIFADSGYVHWLRGNLFAEMRRIPDAEEEFLKAVALDASENTWLSLGMLYYNQGRVPEAKPAMQQAVRLSVQPYLANLRVAHFYLNAGEPDLALQSLDEALHDAPADALAEAGSESLPFQAMRSRANAWHMKGDLPRAIAFDEEAVQISPKDGATWSDLARLYALDGRIADRQRAEERAADLATDQTQGTSKP